MENTKPVPPGALPHEVADNIPIKASEGEYIVPANVVRFLGLDKLEKLVSQAQEKLAELDKNGRIGGDTGSSADELPFNPEDLQRAPAGDAQPVGMAEGGLIADQNSDIDPTTGLPKWLIQMQQGGTTPAPAPTITAPAASAPSSYAQPKPYMGSTSDAHMGQSNELTGTAGKVDNWSVDDFNKYANTRNSTGMALGRAATSLIPGAGLMARMRQRYLDRTVPTKFDEILKTGKDLQGNPLTPEQRKGLEASYARYKSEPNPRGGLIGAGRALGQETGLIKPRTKTSDTPAGEHRLRDLFKPRENDKTKQTGLVTKPTRQAPPAPTKLSGTKSTSKSSTSSTNSSKKK